MSETCAKKRQFESTVYNHGVSPFPFSGLKAVLKYLISASAYQIINVFAVWIIVLTTYSIMFMQIFGLTKYGPNATNEHVNFRTFPITLISLIRYSSG